MAASDFFENFLLHDGVKSLHPNENLSIVPLVSSRDDTTGGYSASGRQPLVGPWCDVRPSRRWGRPSPRHLSGLNYTGTRRSLPGNSAFHAHYCPSPGPAEMAFLSCFHLICWYVFSNIDGSECPIISATALMSASYSRALVGKACRKL